MPILYKLSMATFIGSVILFLATLLNVEEYARTGGSLWGHFVIPSELFLVAVVLAGIETWRLKHYGSGSFREGMARRCRVAEDRRISRMVARDRFEHGYTGMKGF